MTLEDLKRNGYSPADHEFKHLFRELVQKVFKLEERVKELENQAQYNDNWDEGGENPLPQEF